MRRLWAWLAAGGAALIVITLSSCYEKRVIEEVWSPDRKHRAVMYAVLGGQTMDLNTNVSILPIPGGDPGIRANVASFTHGPVVSPEGPYGGPVVTARWLTPSTLEIAYDPRAQRFPKSATVDGVRVVYRVTPQTGLPPVE